MKLELSLANFITKTKIIQDDESYFSLSGDNMPGNCGFYSRNPSQEPVEVRCMGRKNFLSES